MIDISQKKLIERFNPLCYSALSTVYYDVQELKKPVIQPIHFLCELLQQGDSDLNHIASHFEIPFEPWRNACLAAKNDSTQGSKNKTSIFDDSESGEGIFSHRFLKSTEDAWLYTSLVFNATVMRSGVWLLACLKHPELREYFFTISSDFKKIVTDRLEEDFLSICATSTEHVLPGYRTTPEVTVGQRDQQGDMENVIKPLQNGVQSALALYTENLTQAVREGRMDPVVGRDVEIRQVVDILMRRRQNNPILTGEAGVGKTAIVEGLAQRIVSQTFESQLKNVEIHTLDLSALQAGASVKGEFEKRLKTLIREIENDPNPIILFIDEAHTLIGAGGAAGTGDAANILKPALARGQLRCVAATTWMEYKKYFEKDPALSRRFQVVKVEEPTPQQAQRMLRAMLPSMSKHHGVVILEGAVEAAVNLSSRFDATRQLPDKAITLLDTACARVTLSQHQTPGPIEDLRAEVCALQQEIQQIDVEIKLGSCAETERVYLHQRLDHLHETLLGAEKQLSDWEGKWESEKTLMKSILNMQQEMLRDITHKMTLVLPTAISSAKNEISNEPLKSETNRVDQQKSGLPDGIELQKHFEAQCSQLREIQGDCPFVHAQVTAEAIADVVSDATGIPVGKMLKEEIRSTLGLVDVLKEQVLGQDHAMEMIAKRLQTAKANIGDPDKPIGVFLLAGPSGVGKTETALCLANNLFGSKRNLITINMSEFQEAHTVATLKGSPPGYVGYGEGGVLTEAVRKKPYSVVLLDEIEKAHPDVHELFFQVFDKGVMEDAEGRHIDFKNTLILLTSNVGTSVIMAQGRDASVDPEALSKRLRPALLTVFPPALLGRMVTIPYLPLSRETLGKVVALKMQRIVDRMHAQKMDMHYDDSVVSWILAHCEDEDSGGRMIDHVLTNSLLPELGGQLLQKKLMDEQPSQVVIQAAHGTLEYHFV